MQNMLLGHVGKNCHEARYLRTGVISAEIAGVTDYINGPCMM
jgi:hypothetical protein